MVSAIVVTHGAHGGLLCVGDDIIASSKSSHLCLPARVTKDTGRCDAVKLEESDDLWTEVCQRPSKRSSLPQPNCEGTYVLECNAEHHRVEGRTRAA
jgi:hypothetical protein